MASFNAQSADCFVFTYKDGLLSKVAHDLKIRVARFEIEVSDDGSKITARFEPGSLEVVAAMREGREDAGALSTSDRKKIEQSIQEEVLHTRRHGDIRFASKTVTSTGTGHRVEGELTLASVTRTISFNVNSDGKNHVAEVRVHQPDFGLKPFSAMLGTLKIKPEVLVHLRVPVA